MTKLLIDGIEVDVPADFTLLQACEAAGGWDVRRGMEVQLAGKVLSGLAHV